MFRAEMRPGFINPGPNVTACNRAEHEQYRWYEVHSRSFWFELRMTDPLGYIRGTPLAELRLGDALFESDDIERAISASVEYPDGSPVCFWLKPRFTVLVRYRDLQNGEHLAAWTVSFGVRTTSRPNVPDPKRLDYLVAFEESFSFDDNFVGSAAAFYKANILDSTGKAVLTRSMSEMHDVGRVVGDFWR